MILDTTFLIDVLRNDPEAVQKARELEQIGTRLAVTSITVFELWRGFSALQQEKMEKACAMLDRLRMHNLDIPSAKQAGRVSYELERKGQEIDPEDAMIAGIALEKREEILTRNIKHFSRISQLVVSKY